MFSIAKPAENRIDIEIDGHISKVEMQSALESLLELSADLDQGKVMYSIKNLAFPELAAIAVEFKYLPQLFGLMDKFKHVALLTDSIMLENLAKLENKMFRKMVIRTFSLEQKEQAEQWLASVDSSDANNGG